MGVAHEGWPVTAGERTVCVSDGQGGPDGGGDQPVGAADVEDLALGAEDGGDELGVAGQPPDRGRGELGVVAGDPDPGDPGDAGDR